MAASIRGTEARPTRALTAIAFTALLLRGITAWSTLDVPGDGVSRALIACNWSKAPGIVRAQIWLPGFSYLAGVVCMIIPDPLVAPRLTNVLLGSASVVLLYAVFRQIYGTGEALAAAALLAILPLHVGLSASSLTEVGFVFAMLALLWSALGAADPGVERANLYLALVALFGIWVELFRYEGWVLLGIVVAYVAYRRRSPLAAAGLTAVLLCFPLWWSLGNYARSGDPFLGFTAAITDPGTVNPVPPLEAAGYLLSGVSRQVGPAGLLMLLLGALSAAIRLVRRAARPQETFHFALLAIVWALHFGMALRMGRNLWSRYLILGIVLALPLATAAIQRLTPHRGLRAGIAAACVISLAFACVRDRPPIFVTRNRPVDVLALLDWFSASPFRADAVVLTALGWHAPYAKLYRPELSDRWLIVSNYMTDDTIRNFIRRWRPSLFVTRKEDGALRARVESELGTPLASRDQVKTIGELMIFDIREPVRGALSRR